MRRLMAPILLPLLLAAQAPRAAPKPPAKGMPAISAQTQVSGGPRPAEQLAMRFDRADLHFEVLPDRYRLQGIATLDFTATAPLARLILDLDSNLAVTAVAIDGTPAAKGAVARPDGRLVVTLPRPLSAGERVSLRVTYGGTPHTAVNAPWDDGMVWAKTPAGRTWFATTAEGYGCDLFWPCLDFPRGEPAEAILHIVVPKGLAAPSNGRLLGTETLPDGRTRWNWQVAQPNTYAIALNVGPYEELRGTYRSRFGNAVPMFYWHLPGDRARAEGLFAEFAPTLAFFEATVGPYPFAAEKLGVVATPHKGMEHQTINAYGNGYAKAVEGFDWLFQHELAHEWFGNQMTAGDWDDYWLHEAYATWMQPLYGEWREGAARYAAMMAAMRDKIANARPLVSGTSRTEEEVYETAKGGPGQDIYYKGAWMLHTLRWLIGPERMAEVTRRVVYGRPDPRPGNFRPRYASTAEYQAIVRQVTGRDLGWFFDAYLRQAALPELVETRTAEALTLAWRTPRPFPMPIEVEVDGRRRTLPMTDGRETLKVTSDAHVVIDPDARVLRRSTAIEELQAWRATNR